MSLFFVFAGTPSIVDCGTVWLSCVIELSSQVTHSSRWLLTEVSHNSWIVEGYLWLAWSHDSGTQQFVTYYQPTGQ